jgi:hypothetical protein
MGLIWDTRASRFRKEIGAEFAESTVEKFTKNPRSFAAERSGGDGF